MKEPIGYNDEQFDDLPDQDASWRKMEKLLDQEDRRRRMVPVWFRWPVMVVFLAGILAVAIFYVSQTGDDQEPNSLKGSKNTTHDISRGTSAKDPTLTGAQQKDDQVVEAIPMSGRPEKVVATTNLAPATSKEAIRPASAHVNIKKLQKEKRQQEPSQLREISANGNDQPKMLPVAKLERNSGEALVNRKENKVAIDSNSNEKTGIPASRPATPVPPAAKATTDSLLKTIVADTLEAQPLVAKKERSKPARPLHWTIGLSVQQALTLGGQGGSAYNYQGKRNWATDHLPGLYVTAGRKKWWGTASFHYGLPQPVQKLYFSQSTQYDPSTYTATIERFVVEKMYYHQLSLSGNYMVLPRLSAGAGGSYHILAGAVTQRELEASNVITGASQTTTSLSPVKGFRDSFLYQTTAAGFVQAEYHWKRLSLGLRYAYSLQPFIRYTRPDGEIMESKNNNLQLVARFRVWQQ